MPSWEYSASMSLHAAARARYAPPIPEEHDSYCVKRTPERVMVQIFHDGNEVYRCIFVPPADY